MTVSPGGDVAALHGHLAGRLGGELVCAVLLCEGRHDAEADGEQQPVHQAKLPQHVLLLSAGTSWCLAWLASLRSLLLYTASSVSTSGKRPGDVLDTVNGVRRSYASVLPRRPVGRVRCAVRARRRMRRCGSAR